MAEDLLPIVTPAARPDAASAGKPAAKAPETSNDPNDVTFGELIDATADEEAPESTAKPEDPADATGLAPPAQPAPQVNPATNSILSLLQAFGEGSAEGDAEVSVKPDVKADAANPAAALLGLQIGVTPAVQQTLEAATTPGAVAPAVPKAGQSAGTGLQDTADASAETAEPPEGADLKRKPAAGPVVHPAPETGEAVFQAAPGAQGGADDAAPVSSDASKASSAPAQASPSAAAVQPANVQTNSQSRTTTDAPAPDTKIDIAAATSPSAAAPAADGLTAPGQTAEAPKANPALATASPAVVQVYTRMVERMDGRAQRFEIRLDPAELGRVDVKIEVGADQKVHAVLAAHDSAALSDLMRGQKALERALSDAGVDLADGGLQFEMSQDTGRSLSGNEQREGSREPGNVWRGFNTVDVGVDADVHDLALATRSYRRAAARLDLVA